MARQASKTAFFFCWRDWLSQKQQRPLGQRGKATRDAVFARRWKQTSEALGKALRRLLCVVLMGDETEGAYAKTETS